MIDTVGLVKEKLNIYWEPCLNITNRLELNNDAFFVSVFLMIRLHKSYNRNAIEHGAICPSSWYKASSVILRYLVKSQNIDWDPKEMRRRWVFWRWAFRPKETHLGWSKSYTWLINATRSTSLGRNNEASLERSYLPASLRMYEPSANVASITHLWRIRRWERR